MKCSKCEEFCNKKGCTSIMEDYCDGQRYFVPTTRMGFWDWVGLALSIVIICSAIGWGVTCLLK